MRLRFSVRFLLAVTFVAAALCAWCRIQVTGYKRQAMAIAKLTESGVDVTTVPSNGPWWLGQLVSREEFVDVEYVGVPDQTLLGDTETSMAFDDRILKECRKLLSLKRLDLRGTAITDEGLRNIRHLITLESLLLSDTDIGDKGMLHIANLKGLKKLILKRTLVGDEGLAKLNRLVKLEDFRLGTPNVEGQGLAFLQKCPLLESIQFVGQAASNSWVLCSGPPMTLTWVQFHETSIDSNGVMLLRKCTRLKEAYLSNNPIDDEALATLATLPLTTLELDRTNVSIKKLKSMGFESAKKSKRRYRRPDSDSLN